MTEVLALYLHLLSNFRTILSRPSAAQRLHVHLFNLRSERVICGGMCAMRSVRLSKKSSLTPKSVSHDGCGIAGAHSARDSHHRSWHVTLVGRHGRTNLGQKVAHRVDHPPRA